MEKLKVIANLSLSIGLLSLSGAIVYFTATAARTFDDLPGALRDLRETATIIEPVFEDVAKITDLIPEILDETEAVRLLVPGILGEFEATRVEYSQLMDRISADTALVVQEVELVREQVPPILKEVEAVRMLMPDVLNELAVTREALPPMLDRIELLIGEASGLGQQTSEGAVKGVFSGVIKAPFSIVSTGFKMFSKETSDRDLELVEKATRNVLAQDKLGYSKAWKNEQNQKTGRITLAVLEILDGRECRTLKGVIKNKSQVVDDRLVTFCLEDGRWQVENDSN